MRPLLLCPIMALVGCAVTQSPPSSRPPPEPAAAAAAAAQPPEPQEAAPHSDAARGPPLGLLGRPHLSSSVGATRQNDSDTTGGCAGYLESTWTWTLNGKCNQQNPEWCQDVLNVAACSFKGTVDASEVHISGFWAVAGCQGTPSYAPFSAPMHTCYEVTDLGPRVFIEWVPGQSLGTVSQHVWPITALGPVTIVPGVVMPLISNGAITNGSWFPNNTLETVRLTIIREGRPVPGLMTL
eukprot:COSAG01_NODE_3802_length_5684_cov_2.050313_6_plen_239_part_00